MQVAHLDVDQGLPVPRGEPGADPRLESQGTARLRVLRRRRMLGTEDRAVEDLSWSSHEELVREELCLHPPTGEIASPTAHPFRTCGRGGRDHRRAWVVECLHRLIEPTGPGIEANVAGDVEEVFGPSTIELA